MIRNIVGALLIFTCNLTAAQEAVQQDPSSTDLLFRVISENAVLSKEVENLSARITALESGDSASNSTEIKSLKIEIESLKNRLDAQAVGTNPDTTRVTVISSGQRKISKLCPRNHVLVGLSVLDLDSGRYCTSCISGVEMICAPLEQR